jgi:hypothetical protein
MAVGLKLDFPSIGLADYDAVCDALNFPSDWPDGLLSHASVEADGKLRVYDVWESRSQFDDFVASRLGDAMGQALGDRAEQPEVNQQEFHTFYTKP